MRPKTTVLLLFSVLSVLFSSAQAQAPADPSDRYLSGYTAFTKAEKLEADKNYPAALQALKEGSQILNSINTETPNWNTSVVKYRMSKIAEAIQRVQGKMAAAGISPDDGLAPGPGVTGQKSGGVVGNENMTLPGTLPGDPGTEDPTATKPLTGRTPRNSERSATSTSSDPFKAAQEKFDNATKEIERLKNDLDEAEKERKEAQSRARTAEEKSKTTEQRIATLQSRADLAEKALRDEKDKGAKDAEKILTLEKQVKGFAAERRQLEIDREAEESLRKLAGSRNTRLSVSSQTAEKERDAARKTAEDEKKRADAAEKKATAAIAEVQKKLEQVVTEKNALAERLAKTEGQLDVALKQVKQMQEAQKTVDKLKADNVTLMAKLDTAEKQITQFKADNTEKDKLIANLKEEVTSVRKQLVDVQKQSATYQTQMAELSSKLDKQAKELTASKTDTSAKGADQKKLVEENGILRMIIERDIKRQADRDATTKVVLDAVAKAGVRSNDLLNKIKYLGEPIQLLSPKERGLFKKAIVEVSDNSIDLTAITSKPETGTSSTSPEPATVDETSSPRVPSPAPTASNSANTKPAPPTMEQPKKTELAKLETPSTLSLTPSPSTTGTTGTTTSGDTRPEPVNSGRVTESSPSVTTVPADLQSVAQEARDNFDRGNYRDAERLYEKGLAKAPANLYFLENLGVVRFREGKLKLAEESFRKAVAIAPEDAFAHCTLGIILYSMGRYDDAMTELTKALAINPKYAAAHNFIGITASQKGWQVAAIKELEAATQLDPNYADAHFNLAVIYATQQPPEKEKARTHYKRSTELGAEADSSLESLLK